MLVLALRSPAQEAFGPTRAHFDHVSC